MQSIFIAVNLELIWQYPLSEFRPKQTKAASVNRVDLSLWASNGSQYDCVLHVALTATSLHVTKLLASNTSSGDFLHLLGFHHVVGGA